MGGVILLIQPGELCGTSQGMRLRITGVRVVIVVMRKEFVRMAPESGELVFLALDCGGNEPDVGGSEVRHVRTFYDTHGRPHLCDLRVAYGRHEGLCYCWCCDVWENKMDLALDH